MNGLLEGNIPKPREEGEVQVVQAFVLNGDKFSPEQLAVLHLKDTRKHWASAEIVMGRGG